MAKKTLKHLNSSGRIDTRTTARDYTHVVEARVVYAKCNESQRRIYKIEDGAEGHGNWFVIAWCGREDLANKEAAKFSKPGCPWETKAMAINNGLID